MILRLAGELDLATGPALQELLAAAVSDRSLTILVDLSDVEFVDCYSIGLIVAARNAARERGRSLTVHGVHGSPEVVFGLVGLEPLLATPVEDGSGADGRGNR